MLYRIIHPLKYFGLGFAVIVVLALAIAPFSKRLIEQWSRSDVEARSRLVYNAIQNPVVRAIADHDNSRLSAIFESVALDGESSRSDCATKAAGCSIRPS